MKQLIIIWSLILGCVAYAIMTNEEKTKLVLEANADAIAYEMNEWAEHYCDGAPECYPGTKEGVITGYNPLTFGHDLIEKIKYRFPPYNEKLPSITGNLLTYHAPDQEPIVRYLWEISHNKDFLYTVRSENGTLNPFRKSDLIGVNGYRDEGLCQLNRQYHIDFINSPDFQDWKKQADYCWKIYQARPTAFYGHYKRHQQSKYFNL